MSTSELNSHSEKVFFSANFYKKHLLRWGRFLCISVLSPLFTASCFWILFSVLKSLEIGLQMFPKSSLQQLRSLARSLSPLIFLFPTNEFHCLLVLCPSVTPTQYFSYFHIHFPVSWSWWNTALFGSPSFLHLAETRVTTGHFLSASRSAWKDVTHSKQRFYHFCRTLTHMSCLHFNSHSQTFQVTVIIYTPEVNRELMLVMAIKLPCWNTVWLPTQWYDCHL